MQNTFCLSNLITEITQLRYTVEISINFYNKLLSFTTVLGGLSLAIFIKHSYINFTKKNRTELTLHEYYLIQNFILYILCQIIFYWNVIIYSELRNKLVKIIQSPLFVHKFLTRWSNTRIKKKCKDEDETKYLSKIILCIEEENATTIDWLVLDKLIKNKWMDFSILGISTQDGTLVKKVITFSGLIYLILSYF